MSAPQPYPVEPDPAPAFEAVDRTLRCELPGGSFLIAEPAAAQFGRAVKEAFLAVRHGAEAGGLLIGRLEGNDLWVDEIVELPIEYRFGPTFRLSTADLATVKSAARGKALIGFYRSHTRGACALREGEDDLVTTIEIAAGRPMRVILLATPSANAPATVDILLPKGASWKIVERRRLVIADAPPAPLPPVAPAPAPAVVATPVTAPPAPVDVAPSPSQPAPPAPVVRAAPKKRSWGLIVAAPMIIASGAIAGWWALNRSAPAPNPAPPPATTSARQRLGFSAAKENGDWKLTWSPDAVAKLAPDGADLVIRDGANERSSALTAEDLTTGTAFYTPRGSDIVFILRAKATGRPDIEERIRVLGSIPPAAANPAPRGTLRVAPLVERTVERRAFVPPPRTQVPPPAAAALPAPPVLGGAAAVSAPNISGSVLAPAPPPAAPRKAAPAAENPPPAPATAGPVGQPPVLVHQTPVMWPRFAPHSGVYEVKLQVQVDASGNVVKATPLDRSTENVMFVQSALESVRYWKFRPALSNGHSVRGEVELTVHFKQ